MHLQSLELFGFKSFADKTLFQFHEGITAVVGPNGCGKSNLLDAVRWVLGEQSAKALRGGEMADVIFNGTDTRKPLGFAEVSLTLTECAEELGVDWHDVRVTRRIYRDGNSEYFLNKTVCRLRDIQNLFAGTGVARSAYSMMEQGRIDLILSSKPEDRRAVFEEAAGITRYKTQKREALRKLEATEANLLRIGDIIKEVKRQIGSLQRQAGKARRYQALMADLQILDTHHSQKKLQKLEHELATCRREIERINDQERDVRQNIDGREADLSSKRHALDQLDVEIAEARSEVERLQSEIGTNHSRIEFNRQRAEEIGELIARAQSEIEVATSKRERQQTEMRGVNELIERTAQFLTSKQAKVTELTEVLATLRQSRDTRENELQALQVTISKNESRIKALEDEIAGINLRRETTNERLRELDTAVAKTQEERQRAGTALKTAQAATETQKAQVERLVADVRALEEKLQQNRNAIADIEKALITVEGVIADRTSRLEALKQLNEEGEGLAEGSQAVLKGLDDPARIQKSLGGALVAQLDVPSQFVAAVQAALGRNLHAVILRNGNAAPEIVAAITQKKLGKAALVLPEVGRSAAPKPKRLPHGAMAWAIEKAKAPEASQSLLELLLRDVVIVPDVEQAIRFKSANPDLAVATLSGEFISREGVLFGGVSSDQKESLLERKSRIAALASEHDSLTTQRAELQKQRDSVKAAMEKTAADLETVRASHRAADVAQSTAGGKIALIERDLAEADGKIDALESEKNTLRHQLAAADERVAKFEDELTVARKSLGEETQRREGAENARKDASAKEERAAAELNDLRLVIATEQQRHDGMIAQREPLAARDSELNETISARREDIGNYERRLASQANETKAAEAAIEEQTRLQEECKAELANRSNKRSEHAAQLQKIESDLRIIRDSLSELHEGRASEQVRETQLQMKIDNLVEHVSTRYHVDLRGFTSDTAAFEKTLRVQLKSKMEGGAPATPLSEIVSGSSELANPEVETIIADLIQRLDNMGPVNLDAVHEYDELEERHRFLEAQNEDLTASRRELLEVIAKINSTTRQMFTETFAQVRANFREMFAELFGGGRADLSLLDESDPLNCGIEITAKPPGKQLQSVLLLSGGERTMTAVALLFAIYMVRPSPFCVLDELDAPLDESNINRFIRVLERFVAQSQFIIITHNKRTIAKADILYGVTMEERGVSKLVGMKLTGRHEPAAEQQRPESPTQRHFTLAENGHSERKASFAAR